MTSHSKNGMRAEAVKVLQIGNYPPPACGWAIHTQLLVEEIRRRGHVCEVLNINESRKIKSSEYVDVQNGFDYLRKITSFARKGYRFQVHVNGQSQPGYVLAMLAAIVGRLFGKPATVSWHGGLEQKYFPRKDSVSLRWAYRQLFRMAGQVVCNSMPIKQLIEEYGIDSHRVAAIPTFSLQNMDFEPIALSSEIEAFLEIHQPAFFCYVSFRPEYRLPMLTKAMQIFRQKYPNAGFVWLGFPSKEMPAAREYVNTWPKDEREALLLLGNLGHDEFLTLLSRCTAYLRTPVCDGVAASILESLVLGVPVVASENGIRPPEVVTFRDGDEADLAVKLEFLVENYDQIKAQTKLETTDDNIERTVDWLLGESSSRSTLHEAGLAHVQ